MAYIDIQNLSFKYPGKNEFALSDITFSADEGSITLVCGTSGSGKSTFLRMLKKEISPHGQKIGIIKFDSTDIEKLDNAESVKKIGFVMQDADNQIVTDKVYSELAFGLENLCVETEQIRRRVGETADFFNLHNLIDCDVHTLSGGQKQILCLASVMIMQPQILILDEPTSRLDPIAATEFLDILFKINQNLGTTIILSEHRTEELFSRCDSLVLLENGTIIYCGKPADLIAQSKLFINHTKLYQMLPSATRLFKGLGMSSNLPLNINTGRNHIKSYIKTLEQNKNSISRNEHSLINTNGNILTNYEPVISIKNISFRYKKDEKDILNNLSLQINKGELCCVFGGNGAGKTTLFKLIGGVQKPYIGQIKILGKKINDYKNNSLYKNCVSVLPQNPKSLFVFDTVQKELEEMTCDKENIKRTVMLLDIDKLLNCHPLDLSCGEQQKVALAKVLLTDPHILLLDEPTKGMDAAYKNMLGNVLQELTKQNKTIIMATHDVEFAAKFATNCCYIFGGEMVQKAPPKQFFCENFFYTTAASTIAKAVSLEAITVEELIEQLQ